MVFSRHCSLLEPEQKRQDNPPQEPLSALPVNRYPRAINSIKAAKKAKVSSRAIFNVMASPLRTGASHYSAIGRVQWR